MTTLRFRVGEMALLVTPGYPTEMVEVVEVGRKLRLALDEKLGRQTYMMSDYVVHLSSCNRHATTDDCFLVKLTDPDTDESITEEQECEV